LQNNVGCHLTSYVARRPDCEQLEFYVNLSNASGDLRTTHKSAEMKSGTKP